MSLHVSDIAVILNRKAIIGGISFDLPAGQFVAIVGPNGAGKSTLLRVLAGDLVPSHGTVHLGALHVGTAAPHALARRRAVVSQHASADGALTALDIATLGRLPLGGSRWAPHHVTAALDALARCGVDALADRPWSTLSGGERQRVQLARALGQRPKSDEAFFFFLDEVTASLDLGHADRIFAMLKRDAVERGDTVVAVVHDLALASRHADLVLMLAGGALVAASPPREALRAATIAAAWDTAVEVLDRGSAGLIVTPTHLSP